MNELAIIWGGAKGQVLHQDMDLELHQVSDSLRSKIINKEVFGPHAFMYGLTTDSRIKLGFGEPVSEGTTVKLSSKKIPFGDAFLFSSWAWHAGSKYLSNAPRFHGYVEMKGIVRTPSTVRTVMTEQEKAFQETIADVKKKKKDGWYITKGTVNGKKL